MDQIEDDNPLVKTDTDDDHTSPQNNRIEMSSLEKEETILLEVIDNASKSNTTENSTPENSVGLRDSENRLLIGESDSSSSTDSVCRICQLASKETGEEMRSTECHCRGNMSSVHQSCLRQWVYYKGSNRCEICQGRFSSVTPPSSPGILQREALDNLTWQIERTRPFTRRKRAIMTAVIAFLVVVTCVTAMLTVSADREFERLSSNPWVTQDQIDNSNIIFSICIAFSFFCATMTIGLILIWVGMECCFMMHRRRILRRATIALFRDNASTSGNTST